MSVPNSVKEKIQAAPKEIFWCGLLTGTEKLNGQLRDAVEGGQREETEIERAQNSARTTVNQLRKPTHGKKKVRSGAKAVGRSMAKAAAAALRGTVAAFRALAAGGGAVFAVVLVLCLAGALLASPLGIFFCGHCGVTTDGAKKTTVHVKSVRA